MPSEKKYDETIVEIVKLYMNFHHRHYSEIAQYSEIIKLWESENQARYTCIIIVPPFFDLILEVIHDSPRCLWKIEEFQKVRTESYADELMDLYMKEKGKHEIDRRCHGTA